MNPLRLWRWIFPTKLHPEDTEPTFALTARIIPFIGLLCLIWSIPPLQRWQNSDRYLTVQGELDVSRGFTWTSVHHRFTYEIAGIHHSSTEVTFGGLYLGDLPRTGPVTV